MIRLSKLADYGIVLMTYFGPDPGGSVYTARDLAGLSGLPLPTVSKVLKSLARAGLLTSLRGVKGGYSRSQAVGEIAVVEVIRAIDGPIALTDCSHAMPGECEHEGACPVRANWQKINRAVQKALEGLTLADMTTPKVPQEVPHVPGSIIPVATLTVDRSSL